MVPLVLNHGQNGRKVLYLEVVGGCLSEIPVAGFYEPLLSFQYLDDRFARFGSLVGHWVGKAPQKDNKRLAPHEQGELLSGV